MRALALSAAVLLLCGCGGSSSGTSLAELKKSGTTCPVDLVAASNAAGLTQGGLPQVETVTGNGPQDQVFAQGGVQVSCTLPADQGAVFLTVVAVEDGPAASDLLIPTFQALLKLSPLQLDGVAGDLATGPADQPVTLPGAAALSAAPLSIRGASSAVLAVGGGDTVTRAQTDAILKAALDSLTR